MERPPQRGPGGIRPTPFHSDHTFTDVPVKGVALHAIHVPPSGTATSFVSGVLAWATLPKDRQELLAPLTRADRHHSVVADDMPVFVAEHPVRLLHPRTGRPILFVTEWHAERILELDQARE